VTAEQQKTAQSTTGRYKQELARALGLRGNIFITLSGITPAASVFIIAPVALTTAGSGAFLAFVFAGIVGVFMALCWAELSAAFPIAGGDYALVWHSFKGKTSPLAGPVSFITFSLFIGFITFIPATIALGAGTYLDVIANVNAQAVGAIVMAIATVIALFNIRFNAVLTAVFLAIEMLALLVLVVLGVVHARNWGSLAHPVTATAHGSLTAVAFSTVLAVTATAIFSYNGYASAVNFAEETSGSSRNIARAILWSLVITILAELIPITAVVLGSPSLARLSNSAVPLQYFMEATSTSWVNTFVSLLIVIAVLNATLAIVLGSGRILYSSARDNAWGPASKWIAHIHPRLRTPWIATLVIGVIGVTLCLGVSIDTLVELTGASLVADYALIALASIVARLTGATSGSPYRMKLWPLPPLLALACLGYVFTQQTAVLLRATLITMGIGLAYWLVVLLPQRGKAWTLRAAAIEEEEEEEEEE
jgi:amino acid transporter